MSEARKKTGVLRNTKNTNELIEKYLQRSQEVQEDHGDP